MENGREWTGNALDLRGAFDPNGIREVVIEFEGGDSDSFTPRMREDFQAYEIHQMGGYLDSVKASILKTQGG